MSQVKQEPRDAYGRAVKTKCAEELFTIFVILQLTGQQETLGEHSFDNGFEKHRKEKDSEAFIYS